MQMEQTFLLFQNQVGTVEYMDIRILLLNLPLFGKTAKQRRDENSDLKGNIRDYATIEQLIVILVCMLTSTILLSIEMVFYYKFIGSEYE